ncbi:MAG: TlyA family rRNA (cytidine-2'-O)-methyltransferase [Candidatus Saccharimonadales bacterium]
MKQRLDQLMVKRHIVATRSQAESYIKLGLVLVNDIMITKPGIQVSENDLVKLVATEQYVSRAGLKLASVAQLLQLNFKRKLVLDVGSSTGGFTDYALQHGARKVIAVDVGTEQLHPSLRAHELVELYEKTDIRDVVVGNLSENHLAQSVVIEAPDMILIDVSFVSLRQILPTIYKLCKKETQVIAMAKPQFEAVESSYKHKGVIKNDKIRRDILKDFEVWAQQYFVVLHKADSEVQGAKGNRERFYLFKKVLR